MGFKKAQIAGNTFVEILLALGVSSLAAAGALGMLATADSQFGKSRVEALLGGQLRVFQERFAGMPYSSLNDYIPVGQASGVFIEEGFFLQDTPLQLPWRLEVQLQCAWRNTLHEFTMVNMSFTWQEPTPGFPRIATITRTLSCPPFPRSRF